MSPLTYGLRSATDLLAKLHREHARLRLDVSPDNFFNFVVTAYHVLDWIKNDPSVPSSAKSAAESMYSNRYVSICRDLANAGKHFSLDERYKGQVTQKTTSAGGGYGSNAYGRSAYGTSEVTVFVVLADGQRLEVATLADEVVNVWDSFFTEHGITEK